MNLTQNTGAPSLRRGFIQTIASNARYFGPRALRLYRELNSLNSTLPPEIARTYALQLFKEFPEVIKTGSLLPVDRRMESLTCEFSVCGVSVRLPGERFSGGREIYARQVYFPFPHFAPGPEDIVVDLGANRGVFTVLAAKLSKRVIAVEAQSSFIPSIWELLALNGCDTKAAVELGIVGTKVGCFAGAKVCEQTTCNEVEPPELEMNALFAKHDINRAHFVKMDIEGSEFDVLSTNTEWLDRVDRIALEVHTEFGDPQVLVRTLVSRGFDVELTDAQKVPLMSLSDDIHRANYVFAAR